mgnify:FL=1
MKEQLVNFLKWALHLFDDKPKTIAAWPFPVEETPAVKKKPTVKKATTRTTKKPAVAAKTVRTKKAK